MRSVHYTSKAVRQGCVLVAMLAYLLWWHWIGNFPLDLSSDDALNFARGVERFSVLEFRPHFPGYPAFVGFSRFAALWVEPNTAAIWVSLVSAALIPLVIVRLIFLCSYSLVAATIGGVLILTQPLLASMALSGLSDATAILFLLLALVAAVQKQYWRTGAWLGLMLATRPSYVVLALATAMVPWWQGVHRKTGVKGVLQDYLKAGVVIIIVGMICLVFIWAHDGVAYIDEGIRFTQGHFAIWGNTVEGNDATLRQWLMALYRGFGLPLLVGFVLSLVGVIIAVKRQSTKIQDREAVFGEQIESANLAALVSVAILYWMWITIGQNPDNLRHWAPVLLLFIVVISAQLSVSSSYKKVQLAVILTLVCYEGGRNLEILSSALHQRQAPIQQAITWIREQPQIKVVGTNYSVNLLRTQLKDRAVYDMFYPSSERALQMYAQRELNSAWRLSGVPLSGYKLQAQFPPRFMGERRLFLYQISQ
ncbi:hypothetical protein [Photobacterium nomapromontoriensis]|uniref:hypothetical protein n=1 Tax=Photobacterium nomapromontoriensis TaxID=2910237 RepID=UPI003D0D48A8